MDNPIVLLSAIVFLPVAGAFFLLLPGLFDKDKPDAMRYFTLLVTAVVFVLTVIAAVNFQRSGEAARYMQGVFNESWIPSFDIHYFMGIDGISFPLIILTSFISLLAMVASWNITKHVKAYCVLFLLLETGMLGVFMALDFFLFYVFWEVMLLPMYFLIGVWGGPRKEYAAIKFFLYTLVGSVLMLIAILMLYFTSDLKGVATEFGLYTGEVQAEENWDRLNLRHTEQARIGRYQMYKSYDSIVLSPPESNRDSLAVVQLVPDEAEPLEVICNKQAKTVYVFVREGETTADEVVHAIHSNSDAASMVEVSLAADTDGADPIMSKGAVHTFNLLALAAIGQHTKQFNTELLFGMSLQKWAFVLLFIGFIIKVPSVPLHTWLPDAHVEAPTPISMILAGVLLKMGGYGIIRICYPICPAAGYDLSVLVCLIGVISMIYGAFAAMAQKDFKRLVAYSSVSHMGYVVLGLGVWSAWSPNGFNPDYWNMGVKGAMYQMIGHGISSAGMFFMVGVVYDRVHHRNLDQFGGLFGKMPVYTALAIGIFFAGLGLPGLCGFIGEVLVVLSVWEFSKFLAILSAAVVIITAAYILWTIQRVYLGAEYHGPHGDELKPITGREMAVAVPLFIFAIVLGVFPHTIPVLNIPSVLAFMDPTVDRQVDELAKWTERNRRPEAEVEIDIEIDDIPPIGAPDISKISSPNRLRFVSRDARNPADNQEIEIREVDKRDDRRDPVVAKHSKSTVP